MVSHIEGVTGVGFFYLHSNIACNDVMVLIRDYIELIGQLKFIVFLRGACDILITDVLIVM